MNSIGRLLIRTPGITVTADLEVWAGQQRVQTIPASGRQTAGLTGYELDRASETIAHHHRAELVLPWGQSRMPVAFVRPRRIATGAHIEGGQLVIDDCVHIDGLAAGLYLARAPWRAPVIVPVHSEGVIELPAELREAGPILALLRVEDPWTVTEWPNWPSENAYFCDAQGSPIGSDDEETAVSAYLTGQSALPVHLGRLELIWTTVHLSDDLIRRGAPASLLPQCSAVLQAQPGLAIAALLDSGLGAGTSVAALIMSGLAASQPGFTDGGNVTERLWAVLPGAAAVLTGGVLAKISDGADGADGARAGLMEAALAQCGANLQCVLQGDGDPYAKVGQFGPDAERMALLTPEQLEAIWQAAAVVPQALLDADTRAVAARRMFDARRTPALARAAREATIVVRSAERLVAASPYRGLERQIASRRHPDGRGGWLALPAMSAALALTARLAARGNDSCQAFERGWRSRWADIARQAPEIVEIDLVLAETLVAGVEGASHAEETA
jgi:hypothetical protein